MNLVGNQALMAWKIRRRKWAGSRSRPDRRRRGPGQRDAGRPVCQSVSGEVGAPRGRARHAQSAAERSSLSRGRWGATPEDVVESRPRRWRWPSRGKASTRARGVKAGEIAATGNAADRRQGPRVRKRDTFYPPLTETNTPCRRSRSRTVPGAGARRLLELREKRSAFVGTFER